MTKKMNSYYKETRKVELYYLEESGELVKDFQ